MKYPTKPLVPMLGVGSAHIFAEPSLVEPWIDPETSVVTSALRPNVKFDMIGASTMQVMYDNGQTDPTDSIDSIDAFVDAIYYQTKNGKVHRLNVADRSQMEFVGMKNGYGRLILDGSVLLDPHGEPTTLLGRALRSLRNFFGCRQLIKVYVSGAIHQEMGSVEVDVAVPKNSPVKVVGYTMQCRRINLNRRPREIISSLAPSLVTPAVSQ